MMSKILEKLYEKQIDKKITNSYNINKMKQAYCNSVSSEYTTLIFYWRFIYGKE